MEFNIQIPKDHPKTKEFLELVKTLASETLLPSGIKVCKTPIPGAEEAALEYLRNFDIDVEAIKRDLEPQSKNVVKDFAEAHGVSSLLVESLLKSFVGKK